MLRHHICHFHRPFPPVATLERRYEGEQKTCLQPPLIPEAISPNGESFLHRCDIARRFFASVRRGSGKEAVREARGGLKNGNSPGSFSFFPWHEMCVYFRFSRGGYGRGHYGERKGPIRRKDEAARARERRHLFRRQGPRIDREAEGATEKSGRGTGKGARTGLSEVRGKTGELHLYGFFSRPLSGLRRHVARQGGAGGDPARGRAQPAGGGPRAGPGEVSGRVRRAEELTRRPRGRLAALPEKIHGAKATTVFLLVLCRRFFRLPTHPKFSHHAPFRDDQLQPV